MPALVAAEKVEELIRENLRDEGYELSRERLYGQNGTDIIATRGHQCLHIEAIAFKESPPARAKDFYESFFRAVSRLATPPRSHSLRHRTSRSLRKRLATTRQSCGTCLA
jgi:hypothetical protein